MTPVRLALIVAVAGLVAACAAAPVRYPAPDPVAAETVAIGFSSVEIRELTLPTYAAAEEIWFEGPDGGLTSSTETLWADDPTRAVSLELSRRLTEITGAQVASRPWPFEAIPEASLEVRIEEALAGADGTFRLSGQWFVSSRVRDADRGGLFDLATPWNPDAGAGGVGAARSAAVAALATELAASALR